MRQWGQPAYKLPPGLPKLPTFPRLGPFTRSEPPTDTWVHGTHREMQALPLLLTMEQTSAAALSLLALRARQHTRLKRRGEDTGKPWAQGSTLHACQSPSCKGLDTQCEGSHQASASHTRPSP